MKKEYSNGDITVVWQPGKCIHSAICAKGLPGVFKPKDKPWIQLEHASSDEIVNQVRACPSGAISIKEDNQTQSETMSTKIEVTKNGPVLVHGTCTVTHSDGSTHEKDGVTALCRCGHSSNKPYCDGSHTKEDFQG
ncbi:MAG: hypothetical protein HKN32_08940 [Flavobacteriales bacterium]|nr:hypothetical protein [Flavobacteriales bacterium]